MYLVVERHYGLPKVWKGTAHSCAYTLLDGFINEGESFTPRL